MTPTSACARPSTACRSACGWPRTSATTNCWFAWTCCTAARRCGPNGAAESPTDLTKGANHAHLRKHRLRLARRLHLGQDGYRQDRRLWRRSGRATCVLQRGACDLGAGDFDGFRRDAACCAAGDPEDADRPGRVGHGLMPASPLHVAAWRGLTSKLA